MGNWTPVYSTEQRHAIETAALSGRLSLAEIQRRAENGRLDSQLEPFTIPYSSVAYIARAAKKRRAGKDKSPLATMPAADANEHIRQRLLSLADRELTALESRKGKGDPKLAKEWARCVREAAAIPGKEQRRLPTAPSTQPAEAPIGSTLANSILATTRNNTKHDEPITV